MGRQLQQRAGQEPQVVLTTPLLVGLDGEQKMSKSLGNYVGIDEAPAEQFGKIMSIPDPLLPMYFAHATAWPPEQIEETSPQLAAGTLHPNQAKRLVARTVADLYHGPGRGGRRPRRSSTGSTRTMRSPPMMPGVHARSGGSTWVEALVATGLADSKRDARQVDRRGRGAVRRAGRRWRRRGGQVPPGAHVLQNGKRKWARVTVG